LRDGPNNFFVTFIEVLRDRLTKSIPVEEDITTGDYLEGFLLGTRHALHENHRESITLSIDQVDEFHLGVLMGLYERAVGFYASMINVNAYHQPGVEAGKKAANAILKLQKSILQDLRNHPQQSFSIEAIAKSIEHEDCETIFKLSEHLCANQRLLCIRGNSLRENRYQYNIRQ
jgi:glucose-6-phosphate isomerase